MKSLPLATAMVVLCFSVDTRAQPDPFPASPDLVYRPEQPPPVRATPSAPVAPFRLGVGPAVGVTEAQPGLAASMDFGRGPAGLRLGGLWLAAESGAGSSQYGGDLWLDFGTGGVWHPIVGAGGAALRVEENDEASWIGAALARAGLQYSVRPHWAQDARLGGDVLLALPAIGDGSRSPMVAATLSVLVGF